MKKYTKYKVATVSVTSILIVSYEWVRHNILIHYLQKNPDMILSSLLFIVVAIVISQVIFNTLEKLEVKHYKKEIEAKAIFDNSVDGIFVFNSHGVLVNMNEGAMKLSGWDKNMELEGLLTIDNLFNYPGFYGKEYLNIKEDDSNITESILYKKDGSTLAVSLTLSNIINPGSGDRKIAVITQDLSERKQMENVIRDLYKEATQKHYEIEILYNISRKMASLRELTKIDHPSIFESVAIDIKKLTKAQDVGVFLHTLDEENKHKLVGCTNKARKKEFIKILSQFIEKRKYDHETEFEDGMRFIPLQLNKSVLGFISIYEGERKEWSVHQKELVISIINILSITVENLMLYQRVKDVAILEERERLSREMHDGLAQVISSIHIKIQLLKKFSRNLGDKESIHFLKVKEVIKELEAITNEAHHEIRQHLFNLRTPFPLHKPFINSLEEYLELFKKQNELLVSLRIDQLFQKREIDLSHEIKIHISRIIQEALSNIKKHANASQVTVELKFHEDQGYEFIISDNGIGFNYKENKDIESHYGLAIMEERANIFGGRVNINTERGKGTRVIVSVPKER